MPDLCTLNYIKNLVDPSGTTTSGDVTYAALISAASAAFLNYTNRAYILATQLTETRDGDGSDTLILRDTPIISIDALSVAQGTGIGNFQVSALKPFTGTSPGYVLADNGFEVALVGTRFHRGYRNITVTYTAGYASVPLDIQQAVAEMVLWKKAKMPRIDTNSHSLAPGETISFSQADMPPSAKTVIKQYTQWGGFRSR